MDQRIALLRGINVGKAKRVPMAALKDLMAGLGFADVRTLLNSGNVVFTVPPKHRGDPAQQIASAIAASLGVVCRVLVLTAAEWRAAMAEMPHADVPEASRLVVMFPCEPGALQRLDPLRATDWQPAELHVGRHAAFLWCPDGLLATPLGDTVMKAMRDEGTGRNWATVTRLAAMLQD
jgi:uncharacterized protein (DUF1697 family)